LPIAKNSCKAFGKDVKGDANFALENLEIRNAVTDADIEVFYVKAQELWADESLVEHLRHNPGWGPSEQ
jgi:hypothetical protein